jgi:hypothetical protein
MRQLYVCGSDAFSEVTTLQKECFLSFLFSEDVIQKFNGKTDYKIF